MTPVLVLQGQYQDRILNRVLAQTRLKVRDRIRPRLRWGLRQRGVQGSVLRRLRRRNR